MWSSLPFLACVSCLPLKQFHHVESVWTIQQFVNCVLSTKRDNETKSARQQEQEWAQKRKIKDDRKRNRERRVVAEVREGRHLYARRKCDTLAFSDYSPCTMRSLHYKSNSMFTAECIEQGVIADARRTMRLLHFFDFKCQGSSLSQSSVLMTFRGTS